MSRTTINKAIEAAEHPILLQSSAQLAEAERAWSGNERLGIDTEFVRERTYRADLGLVQVSDGITAWLIDPLAVGSQAPLERLLSNSAVLKILHSGSEDLEVLLHSLGTLPDPLVDTQIACAMLGQSLQLGFHHAARWLFDVEIAKDQTRSNWCKRPLHTRQLRYAAMDVVLLPLMLEELKSRLESAGRWSWLKEEVFRMQRNALETVDPDKAWLRFGGAGRLDDEGLRVLKALAKWREVTAMERNRARGFVISDAGLMQLAQLRPSTAASIRTIEAIHPGALARYEGQILKLIADAEQDRAPVERNSQLNDNQRSQLKDMRRVVQSRAAELGVEPALLASRKELEKLVRACAGGQPPPERFLGWRKDVITDELMPIIR